MCQQSVYDCDMGFAVRNSGVITGKFLQWAGMF
jgi:hypothetical protein